MAIKTIELFVNETTEGREQLTKVIKFNGFTNLQWAELKVNLHANDSFSSPLPTEWKLTKIIVNGVKFYPSGKLISTNKIHDSKGSAFFQKVLRVNDVNTVSIHWIAPLGAGVLSPNGAVTAVLSVIGDSVPFAEDLQFDPRNSLDSVQRFADNQTLPTLIFMIILIVILALIAFTVLKVAQTASSVKSSTGNVKGIIKEVKTLK